MIKITKKTILLFLLLGTTSFQQNDRFIGKVVAEWSNDGRNMKLLQDFTYVDPNGSFWKTPKGTIVDGASIPKIFWTTIGGPFEGKYRNASVVHDYYCQKPYTSTWKKVHKMFYDACITGGVSKTKAKVMYAAVYAGGPRWDTITIQKKPGNRVEEVVVDMITKFSENDFENIAKWIDEDNPDLKAITDSLDSVISVKKKNWP